jgi:membrane-associated phospholipid phosphatase
MKKQFAFLLLAILPGLAVAQQPYDLRWPREIAITTGSAAGIGASYLLQKRSPALSPEDVAALDPARIPRFDRYATRHFSAPAKKASDILLFSSVAIPALLLFDGDIRRDAGQVGVITLETMLMSTALTVLAKELVRRPRPFNHNAEAPLALKLQQDARRSFFSGHTSLSAAACFATAKIWSDYHPGSDWKPVVWATAAAIPATVGYLRMRAGKHYLSDVFTGFVVGSAVGMLVPQWHRRRGH